jgi:hypothetical protein
MDDSSEFSIDPANTSKDHSNNNNSNTNSKNSSNNSNNSNNSSNNYYNYNMSSRQQPVHNTRYSKKGRQAVLDSAVAVIAAVDALDGATPNGSDNDEETPSEETPSEATGNKTSTPRNEAAGSDAVSSVASDNESTSCTSSDGTSKLRQSAMPTGEKQVSRGRKGRTGRPRKKSRPSGNNSQTEIESQLEELCESACKCCDPHRAFEKTWKSCQSKEMACCGMYVPYI